MKETKNFFETNRLNKGYSSSISINKQSDVQLVTNRYKHVLPDIDVMAEYEEMSPGTISKIFDMAKREQNHRHSVDLLNIEKHAKVIKIGRLCSLAVVSIISIATIILALKGHYMIASVFSVAAFAVIGTVSIKQSSKRFNNKFNYKNNNHNNNRAHNHKPKGFNR
ncbi:MAG: DUF2335 domain-containing protein [Rickettsiaceae bacterium]